MKVCFFAHYSKTYQNGATLSLINIANEMVDKGIEVIIILPNKSIQYPINNKKIKCITIPTLSMRTKVENDGVVNKFKGIIKSFYNWFSMKKALMVLNKEKLDFIHINGLDSGIGAKVAKKLNVPYIWHIRQLLEEDFGMKLHNEKKIYKLLKRSDSIIAISKTVKEKFERIVEKDIALIYNGIPIKNYRIEEKESFSDKVINILLAGRIIEQKGQFDAVKAIGHLVNSGINNLHLTIVGNSADTDYVNKIKSYIKNQGLNNYIEISDHVNDLRQLRKNCDIGLICSKKEAFGRVTIETMISRMLAIGANTGGTAEVIEDNVTGLLYVEGDHLSLASQIKYAIENKQAMNTIIEEGYKSVLENYSISGVVDQIIDLYYTVRQEKLEE